MRPQLVIALGKVLKDARVQQGLSQEELAGLVGVHRNTVGLIERAEMSVSIETLDEVCEKLGYRPWQLLLEAEFISGR